MFEKRNVSKKDIHVINVMWWRLLAICGYSIAQTESRQIYIQLFLNFQLNWSQKGFKSIYKLDMPSSRKKYSKSKQLTRHYTIFHWVSFVISFVFELIGRTLKAFSSHKLSLSIAIQYMSIWLNFSHFNH